MNKLVFSTSILSQSMKFKFAWAAYTRCHDFFRYSPTSNTVMFESRLSYLYHSCFLTREMGDLINLAEVIIKGQLKYQLNLCYRHTVTQYKISSLFLHFSVIPEPKTLQCLGFTYSFVFLFLNTVNAGR